MIPVLVKRDFTSRVKGTAYILTTLIGVLVIAGLTFIPPLLDQVFSGMAPKRIDLYVYEQPTEASIVPYLLEVAATRENVSILPAEGASETELYQRVLDEALTGLLLIDGPCTPWLRRTFLTQWSMTNRRHINQAVNASGAWDYLADMVDLPACRSQVRNQPKWFRWEEVNEVARPRPWFSPISSCL